MKITLTKNNIKLMKNILIVILSLFLITSACKSQNESGLIQDDSLLVSLKEKIPQGWTVSIAEDKLIIEKNDSVWVLSENKINAPISILNDEEEIKRIKEFGKKVQSSFVFQLEDKWSEEKCKQVRDKNETIYTQIKVLPEKYEIVYLYDSSLSRKGLDVFIGNTDEERKRIHEYEVERFKIEKGLIKIPDYNSEKYSLFLISKIGIEDEFHTVYPKEASEEMYRIEKILKEVLQKDL